MRPYAGVWSWRYGVTVVLFGYGIWVGLPRYADNDSWVPLKGFRNSAYRGLRP